MKPHHRVFKLLKLAVSPFTNEGRSYLKERTRPFREFFWVRVSRSTWARHKPVIVVVGSFGKTTATRSLLKGLGYAEGNAADSGNHGRLAARKFMRQAWSQRHIVMEVGIDGPGLMRKRAGVFRPDVVVFLCVGLEHILSFRDKAHIAEEKAQALRAIRPGGFAVINSDDPLVSKVAAEAGVRLVRFGFEPGADCRGLDWQLNWAVGSRLHYRLGSREGRLESGLLSRAPSYALLATLATCHALGEDIAKVEARLQGFAATPGRLEALRAPSGALIIRDDFKSTLETMHLALDLLEQFEGRRFAVLSRIDAPPNPQRLAYQAVAAHVGRVADEVILVRGGWQNNYKSELNRQVASDSRLSKVTEMYSSEEVVAYLRPQLRPGVCVIVKKCRESTTNYVAQETVALELASLTSM
jgi:UDP-N-acetylmuramoyl-tripeptide--D-alanyl-D-alanine ligase